MIRQDLTGKMKKPVEIISDDLTDMVREGTNKWNPMQSDVVENVEDGSGGHVLCVTKREQDTPGGRKRLFVSKCKHEASRGMGQVVTVEGRMALCRRHVVFDVESVL